MSSHIGAPSNSKNYHKSNQNIVISTDKLADTILEGLKNWNEGCEQAIIDTTEELAKQGVEMLKDTAPRRTGAYAKSMHYKLVSGSGFAEATLYNQKHYQITHLLENGHRKKNGGSVKAYPHWEKVEEEIKREYEERLKAIYEH